MNAVKLNLINRSNHRRSLSLAIFQKNEAASFDDVVLAWKVIRNLAPGFNHPFTFPWGFSVDCSDSWANYTPQLPAKNGDAFELIPTSSGNRLVSAGQAPYPNEITVYNSFPFETTNANIYKDGSLLAVKINLGPRQKAVFSFKPAIYIGIVSHMQQGEILNSATLAGINTEISLLGISSADIVITGGDTGTGATAYTFTLANVTYV